MDPTLFAQLEVSAQQMDAIVRGEAKPSRVTNVAARQPIEVRREYIEPNREPHPLYIATRIHIAELWLEMRK